MRWLHLHRWSVVDSQPVHVRDQSFGGDDHWWETFLLQRCGRCGDHRAKRIKGAWDHHNSFSSAAGERS